MTANESSQLLVDQIKEISELRRELAAEREARSQREHLLLVKIAELKADCVGVIRSAVENVNKLQTEVDKLRSVNRSLYKQLGKDKQIAQARGIGGDS